MAKRGENIYKRKDKRWEGRFKCGVTAAGKTAYKSVYARTYSQCREKLKRAQSAYLLQLPEQAAEIPSKISFGMLAQQWLAAVRPTVKESTLAVYCYIVTHYLKALERKGQQLLCFPAVLTVPLPCCTDEWLSLIHISCASTYGTNPYLRNIKVECYLQPALPL